MKNYRARGLLHNKDNIRSFTVGFMQTFNSKNGAKTYVVAATRGLGNFLGGMGNNEKLSSKLFAGNDFTKLNGLFSAQFNTGRKSYMLFKGAGQISTDRMVYFEEFPLGGIDSVRGFMQNEHRGDIGYNLNAEYHYRIIPADEKNKNLLEGLVFFDQGQVGHNNRQPHEWKGKTLTGWGFGVKAENPDCYNVRAELGFPLYPEENRLQRNPVLYVQAEVKM
jgi:hemolysin activation/secretion protein